MKQKLFRPIPLVFLVLFVLSLAFVILAPTPDAPSKRVDLIPNWVVLSQIRLYFAIPLCFFCGVGLLIRLLDLRLPARQRWLCPAVGGVMTVLGIYGSLAMTLLLTFPPIPYNVGIFLLDNRWLLNTWWAIAGGLLALPIMPRQKTAEPTSP